MFGTQNETVGIRMSDCGLRNVRSTTVLNSAFRNPQSAFTLVELLVVITIIGILAALITGAVLNALNKAKQAAITMEIQQLESAMEDFKNEYGMYPPNVFANSVLTNPEQILNGQVLLRALKRVSSRSVEYQTSVSVTSGNNNVATFVVNGLSPAEALVFWLQGFSSDVTRPFSGSDLEVTQIDDNGTTVNNVITIDSYQPRFDFDKGRLQFSRDSAGARRFLEIYGAGGVGPFQLQLYEYLPKNSQEPYVYFDTSRETPQQVVTNWETTEFFYSNPTTGGNIYPIKRLRANAPVPADMLSPTLQYVEYVESGKFQILHAGIDDLWGDFSNGTDGAGGALDVTVTTGDFIPNLLFPTGPFLGDVADTVGNFMSGTLEDEQE